MSPAIDAFCVGGASIFVIAALLLLPLPSPARIGAGGVLAVGALLNWPHFMASYRLLYASAATIRAHSLASIWFPAALGLYTVVGVTAWTRQPIHLRLLECVATLYLARHYTGQTWGMMASFSHIEETPFAPHERRLVRFGLFLIMMWHLAWGAALLSSGTPSTLASITSEILRRMTPVAGLSFALGALGLALMGRRLGRVPPLRIVLPFVALYAWYALLATDVSAAFVVQAAHAIQYMSFPLRVEMNRDQASPPGRLAATRIMGWTVLGLATFSGVPALVSLGYRSAGGEGPFPEAVAAAIGSFISIHHYFVDGALYKLRNPAVRRDLFSHLPPRHAAP